jgi:hypothetical protein
MLNSAHNSNQNVDSSTAHNSATKVGELYNGKHGRNFGESQAAGEPILHCGNKHPKVSFRKEKPQPSIDNKEIRYCNTLLLKLPIHI